MALKKPPHLQSLLYLAAEDKQPHRLAGHNGFGQFQASGVRPDSGCSRTVMARQDDGGWLGPLQPDTEDLCRCGFVERH